MFEKKFKVKFMYKDSSLGMTDKTKKVSEKELEEYKDRDDIKIISIDGVPFRK